MPRWKELKRFCDRDGWELIKRQTIIITERNWRMVMFYKGNQRLTTLLFI